MIVECKVWCTENSQNERLGLPEGDCWMPITFDFKKVECIKLAGSNDFLGDNKACLYTSSGMFIIDMTYSEACNKWKEIIK